MRHRLTFFQDMWRTYGDVVRIPFGAEQVFLLNDPTHLEHVLLRAHGNYHKSSRINRARKLVLDECLLTTDGEVWKRQRLLAQPAFTRAALSGYVPDMIEVATAELDGWRARVDGPAFDVSAPFVRLAVRVTGKTLFGSELSEHVETVRTAVHALLASGAARMSSLLPLPLWIPTGNNRALRSALRALDEVVWDVIRRAREEGVEGRSDILARMMTARDEEGRALTDQELRNQVVNFLTAGYESTAAALAWTLFLIGQRPSVQDALAAEVAEVLAGRPPLEADVKRLELCGRVIRESMRLYPPAWLFDREAVVDDVVGGYRIPRGAQIMISPYLLHRHPEHWEDPERFDPDRFLPERVAARHPMAYLPFSKGPRFCVGEQFSMVEMILTLALFAQRYRVEVDPQHPVELLDFMTLRNAHGVQCVLRAARSG